MSDAPPFSRKAPLPAQSSSSGRTLMTSRLPYTEPIASKHVCFYKSGDAQFSGLPVVINNRTFKTFESLLDNLSKRVPLPFGVRTITTPRGHTTVRSLEQLRHGHAYLCSDRRPVKPVDLDRARRKPPPWYHPRPVSEARRRALQHRDNQGVQRRAGRRQESRVLLHTPKRLVVFRNGEPEERHTLLLHKRNAQSFETLLGYMSHVMQFPVMKLHTPDGRRVDGLPALILCSGVLVAAGREPFKSGDYNTQRPPAPTWLPAKRVGEKKKSPSSSSKSHLFSPSSERFLINQLQNSVRVAETDTLTIGEGMMMDDAQIFPDDDIEKSFRVNQDGSMTVEMKVRLTIKEEETVQWTTTLSRSSITNQIKASQLSQSSMDTCLPVSCNPPPDPGPSASEVSNGRNSREHNGLPPLENSSSDDMEPEQQKEETKIEVSQGQASMESIHQMSEMDIEENVRGSYSYREEMQNGELKQGYCMMQQCSSRPVPKPRSTCLPEGHSNLNASSSLQSHCKSTEIVQLKGGGEEIRETVLHIYEQQTCQDNFLANAQLHVQGLLTCSPPHVKPASSEVVGPEILDKPFCSSSMMWASNQGSSTTSGSFLGSRSAFQALQSSCKDSQPTENQLMSIISPAVKGEDTQRSGIMKKRRPVKFIVRRNHILQTITSEKKHKEHLAEILKDIRKKRNNADHSCSYVKLADHLKAKAVQQLLKKRNKMKVAGYRGDDYVMSFMVENINNEQSAVEQQDTIQAARRNVLEVEDMSGKAVLVRQTSMHEEEHSLRESKELTESISLPALHSSSSMVNEYVQHWLQMSKESSTPPSGLASKKKKTKQVQNKSLPVTPEHCDPARNLLSYPVPKKHSPERTSALRDDCKRSNASDENAPRNSSALSKNLAIKMVQQCTKSPLGKTISPQSTQNDLLSYYASLESVSLSEKSQTPTIISSKSSPLSSYNSLDNQSMNDSLLDKSLSGSNVLEKANNSLKKMDEVHASGTLTKATQTTRNQSCEKPKSSKLTSSQRSDMLTPNTRVSSIKTGRATTSNLQKKVEPIPTTYRVAPDMGVQTKRTFSVRMAARPDMRPVLDQLCLSIQSLKQMSQHKRPSCLEKSNSVPDFSSHVASTFGSSSRVLLAFLCVMTLKDGLANLSTGRQPSSTNPSYSEALMLLDSLKELARIEDAALLNASLSSLQKSVSAHLLHSWRGFQDLSDKAMSCSVSPSSSKGDESSSEGSEEEKVMQELMGELGVPERVREELAALGSDQESMAETHHGQEDVVDRQDCLEDKSVEQSCLEISEQIQEGESIPMCKGSDIPRSLPREDTVSFTDAVLEDEVHVYVKSITNEIVAPQCKVTSDDDNSASDQVTESGFHDEEPSRLHGAELENSTKLPFIYVDKQREDHEESRINDGRQSSVDEAERNIKHKQEKEKEASDVEELETVAQDQDSVSRLKYEVKATEPEECKEDRKSSSEDDEEKFSPEEEDSDVDEEEDSCEEEERVDSNVTEKDVAEIFTSQDCAEQQPEELASCEMDQNVVKNTRSDGHHGTNHEEEDNRQSCSMEEHFILDNPECYTIYQESYNVELTCSPQNRFDCGKILSSPTVAEQAGSIAQTDSSMDGKVKLDTNARSAEHLKTAVQSGAPDSHELKVGTPEGKAARNAKELRQEGISSAQIVHTTESSPNPRTPSTSSSLAFSYDSKGQSKDIEGDVQNSRVKLIREMFMAKSNTNSQSAQRRIPSSCTSEVSESRPETSDGGDYSVQASPELLSGEEDTGRLSIAKGYVRRTIEHLYGKSTLNAKGPEENRAISGPRQKRRDCSSLNSVSSLTSFHEARSQVKADLSYFNATSSFEASTEPMQCITLNAQVDSAGAILIDKGRWLLRENQNSPSFLSESGTLPSGDGDDRLRSRKDDASYSLFHSESVHVSEREETPLSQCTYLTLPHGADSDPEEENSRAEAKTSKRTRESKTSPATEAAKTWAEKNGSLSAFIPEFRVVDNKVHPLPDGPVVTQPPKGQAAQKALSQRPPMEPDLLEVLYDDMTAKFYNELNIVICMKFIKLYNKRLSDA
uniref:Doublecortin domain-containing protein n=1 Tax=Denticeps clupeoides TaxID=299321 RepID=A0AAY3ZZP7_9TELE